ncbi:methyltransferase domain-containing protein [Methyloceanibacter sp. wino2]|uniref:methyltransferase domain-containing protein n=1 Tax=Methyloceanibacter sp. wino2 TaxID=2170729 RepID=UPI000D3EC65E|nr:methyltransferase domain-containing protein [Methyloceanibacter sp. wino2]
MNIEVVKEYYGKVLKGSGDLQTSACCDGAVTPRYLTELIANVHDEVVARYYGCGLCIPTALQNCNVLDLGSGTGRDVYILSQLVGEGGSVTGVDMTAEQLATADAHRDWHAEKFGYAKSNVRFLEGYLEKLDALNLEPGSFDVIVSNCVINLCMDKPAVLRGAYDLLKQGGELYFADVYCDRRLPDELRADPLLYGECLGGALYWNDFLPMAKQAGFLDPRLVSSRPIEIDNPDMREKLGNARFFSATYRLFKLDDLEPACEDYGQAVIYRGGVFEQPETFVLDDHHLIEKDRIFPVCGNVWRMLAGTRFAPYFDFVGDFSKHFGIFPGCGTPSPFEEADKAGNGSVSCC